MMQIKLRSTIKIEEMRRNPKLGINPKVERLICLNSNNFVLMIQRLITIDSNISIYSLLRINT